MKKPIAIILTTIILSCSKKDVLEQQPKVEGFVQVEVVNAAGEKMYSPIVKIN